MATFDKAKKIVGKHLPLTFRPDKELVQQEIRTALGLPPYVPRLSERAPASP